MVLSISFNIVFYLYILFIVSLVVKAQNHHNIITNNLRLYVLTFTKIIVFKPNH